MTIIKDYIEYTKEWKSKLGEKTIVLMQVGSFFEVYALKQEDGTFIGSDIVNFSQINDMLIAGKKQSFDGKPVFMAGFGLAQLEKYTKKLQEHQYTVVVYRQDIQGANTTRSLCEIISPGTYFSSDTPSLSNITMAIWLQHVKASRSSPELIIFGVSTIDIFTGDTTLHEFTSAYVHNPCTYDSLEKYVAVHRPVECLVVSNLDERVTSEILSFVGLDQVKTHINSQPDKINNASKQTYQMEFFSRFYPNMSKEMVTTDIIHSYSVAVQGFVLLIDFIYQHSPQLTTKLKGPVFETDTTYMTLANHSLKQLNILDDARENGKLRSVGAFLNNCMTAMGRRKFMYCLHHPVTDCVALQKSYDSTEAVLQTDDWRSYRESLTGVHDLEKWKRKLLLRKTTPKDFGLLITDLRKIQPIYNGCDELLCELENVFDIDTALKVDGFTSETMFFRPGVNSKLDQLANDMKNSRKKMEAIAQYLSNLIGNLEKGARSKTFVKIHETPKADPVLLTTKRRATILKNAINNKHTATITFEGGNFILDLSEIKFGTYGTNKKEDLIMSEDIRDIISKVQSSRDELTNEIALFYQKYLDDFSKHFAIFDKIVEATIEMDILQSKAYIAHTYNYCKPKIESREKSFCNFTKIRHPLIEHLQTDELYVTNDLNLQDGFLIYGTNAVGKTSLIKSVGIAVIMAQAGLYVPCESFVFAPFKSIFTRILGNDNLFKGLSTFAVEMSELRIILNMADQNSLILGDELCSGTESDSALSIFTAGLERLHSQNSSYLFATHFHEVVHYDEIKQLDRLQLMHMEVTYDRARGCLVYDRKLKPGSGNTMYGLEVCKSLNLPDDFLERAHSIRNKYNKITTGILEETGSHFNVKKIGGNCENCGRERATEVHHINHQADANKKNGYIDSFHKNHKANLVNLCEFCHKNIHAI